MFMSLNCVAGAVAAAGGGGADAPLVHPLGAPAAGHIFDRARQLCTCQCVNVCVMDACSFVNVCVAGVL